MTKHAFQNHIDVNNWQDNWIELVKLKHNIDGVIALPPRIGKGEMTIIAKELEAARETLTT